MSVIGRTRTLVAATVLCGAITAAQAAEDDGFTWFGQSADGNWMLGTKIASVGNGRGAYDDAANLGIIFGYRFERPLDVAGTASIEFEYSNSFDNGNISSSSGFGVGGDWQSEHLGMYFGYRTPGNVYFLARLGALSTDVTTNLDGLSRFSEQDTSFSYGAGLGLLLGETGNFNVELEFLGSSGDNDINMITIGGTYIFP
jgi:hypothetical protein